MSRDSIINRHHVRFLGPDTECTSNPTLILAHGFGCDQQIWEPVAKVLARDYPLVLFDHLGCGRSNIAEYKAERYTQLTGYADDLIVLLRGLQIKNSILVGHSVSGAIGWLASIKAPELFEHFIAIGPSPRYINDPPDYIGGFEEHDVREMIDLMERNHYDWAGYLAPIVMGGGNRPELAETLRQTFLNADPVISRRFAETTFMSDIRAELPNVTVPTLILYCAQDIIVPVEVIRYLRWTLPHCNIKKLNASGHYPHMTNPTEVAHAIHDGVSNAD